MTDTTTIGGYEVHEAARIFPLMDDDDRASLLESMRRQGFDAAHPIVLLDGKVLDGRNRLLAALEVGVEPVFRDATADEAAEPMAFVWRENAARRHLSKSQMALAAAEALPLFQREAKARQREHGGTAPGRGTLVANLPPVKEKARDAAARGTGVSPRTVEHAATVLESAVPEVVDAVRRGKLAVSAAAELARLDADAQRDVVARAEARSGGEIRGGLVRALAKQVEKARVAAQLDAAAVAMPTGRYSVIVADPPWAYQKRAGDATHRGDLPYPPMSTDEICALDVASLAEDDCVLWLWTTNAFMRDAFRVIDSWGFEERTILTWAKNRIGLGDWLRGQTEHCILAARGKPTLTLVSQTTLLHGDVREHSRKPDEFYSLVESLCHGSKLELFCRTPRLGWAKWGAETEKFSV
jgi:N6-adenosine-specific RNA methylase IME4